MIKVDELKRKMKDKGYTINSLATASNVNKSIISRLLSDPNYNCAIGTVKKLSKTLRLSNEESVFIFLN